MKFDELCSIGHNLVDSLDSAWSTLFGNCGTGVFDDVARNPDKAIEIDFLSGAIIGGDPSEVLTQIVGRSAEALSLLCERHGTTPSAFRTLIAIYSLHRDARRVQVIVENTQGRRRTDEYFGSPPRCVQVGKHPPVSAWRAI